MPEPLKYVQFISDPPPPPLSAAHETFPDPSVVSFPPLPSAAQLSVARRRSPLPFTTNSAEPTPF